jgi:molybdopterin converting factor small subunit
MNITVEYWAQLRTAAGQPFEAIELPAAASLADLLEHVAARHGPALRSVLFDQAGKPRTSNIILVNQEMVRLSECGPLTPNAVVTLLSPMAGG